MRRTPANQASATAATAAIRAKTTAIVDTVPAAAERRYVKRPASTRT